MLKCVPVITKAIQSMYFISEQARLRLRREAILMGHRLLRSLGFEIAPSLESLGFVVYGLLADRA